MSNQYWTIWKGTNPMISTPPMQPLWPVGSGTWFRCYLNNASIQARLFSWNRKQVKFLFFYLDPLFHRFGIASNVRCGHFWWVCQHKADLSNHHWTVWKGKCPEVKFPRFLDFSCRALKPCRDILDSSLKAASTLASMTAGNISYIPFSHYSFLVFFIRNFSFKIYVQEHFICDEEPCGEGSQAVQQRNDQEMKSSNLLCNRMV